MLSGGKLQLTNPADAARAAKLAPSHKGVQLNREELIRITTWIETNGQYYGSYYGKRNLRYRNDPEFRPVPTLEAAVRSR